VSHARVLVSDAVFAIYRCSFISTVFGTVKCAILVSELVLCASCHKVVKPSARVVFEARGHYRINYFSVEVTFSLCMN